MPSFHVSGKYRNGDEYAMTYDSIRPFVILAYPNGTSYTWQVYNKQILDEASYFAGEYVGGDLHVKFSTDISPTSPSDKPLIIFA
jgi:hypothetical protein